MKLLFILILGLSFTSQVAQAFDSDWEYDYTDEIVLQGDARFLNLSFDGVFNNSLLTLAGIFVVGVIMFGKIFFTISIVKLSDFLLCRIGVVRVRRLLQPNVSDK